MKIKKNLDVLINDFINSNADIGIMTHPDRNNIEDELNVWKHFRGYHPIFVNNQINLKHLLNNYQDDKLYQIGLRICKNTQLNQTLDDMVYSFLKYLGYNNNQ